MAEKEVAPVIDTEKERKEILGRYRDLLRATKRRQEKGDRQIIRKAFNVALEAHKDMRRKSGEPYIYHPIAVAKICAEEIGLGTTAVVCALLHDTVEDTDITLDDIKGMFGEKVAKIIDGLTKISGVFDQQTNSLQAENFRKMLLTLSDDIRVILIKLADRLHNMRTLDSMKRDKQLKIASETLYLYGPLAHRLGLNAMKTELEDLGLKFTEPEVYNDIARKLQETEPERKRFIQKFIQPINEILHEQGFKAKIIGRPKSIYSIYNKIRHKGVPFEEIYDLFAIRIIIRTPQEKEKSDCWRVYSIVTDFYHPNPDRLRDWISTPKANGYESLHTTVMGPEGKWVEVQIRTERMDELAEKGYAAHWKYKDGSPGSDSKESQLEDWLRRIREILESPEENALDFIDDFKLNLFAEEIFVFTPKGEMKTLPNQSTALDFAFEIHTKVGEHCIGAKVNHKLVPLSHPLKSGDQVEILTSSKQSPKEDWLSYVITARAKAKIKNALKEEKRRIAEEGREILERKFDHLKIDFTVQNINALQLFLKLPTAQDLFYRIAKGIIALKHLKAWQKEKERPAKTAKSEPTLEQVVKDIRGKKAGDDALIIGDNLTKIEYKLSPCCNPIPGDDVFGFITIGEGIKIHRVTCPNALQMMSNYAYRIVKARWTAQEQISFLAGIKVSGIDEVGLVNNITRIISSELSVNMRSLSFDTHDGTFDGTIMLFVHDTQHLTELMKKLKKVHGVIAVTRINPN
ncbi:MAG TPA: bifunctional (p)ppGpp synthetase/guanosine-3',5'-bis(diphosphate) 3'-pyrophosphohydrolase [Bacteroidia bacterium]|nr:bifunctional (p)ppGpp synthetase/guanosine-3',5'-bis(diphosphate) 3'-pyrophosphohydrolase [Bacteroidia bacterium]